MVLFQQWSFIQSVYIELYINKLKMCWRYGILCWTSSIILKMLRSRIAIVLIFAFYQPLHLILNQLKKVDRKLAILLKKFWFLKNRPFCGPVCYQSNAPKSNFSYTKFFYLEKRNFQSSPLFLDVILFVNL